MSRNANSQADGPVLPPAVGSIYFETAAADWQADGEKFWIKPLYENQLRGEPTMRSSRSMCFQVRSMTRTERCGPATTPAGRPARCTPRVAKKARCCL